MFLDLILLVAVLGLDRLVGEASLIITLVVVWSWLYQPPKIFVAALFLGIFHDLENLQLLGVTSIGLLVVSVVIYLVRLQFDWRGILGVMISAGLAELCMQIIGDRSVFLAGIGVQMILSAGLWSLYTFAKRTDGVYLRRN